MIKSGAYRAGIVLVVLVAVCFCWSWQASGEVEAYRTGRRIYCQGYSLDRLPAVDLICRFVDDKGHAPTNISGQVFRDGCQLSRSAAGVLNSVQKEVVLFVDNDTALFGFGFDIEVMRETALGILSHLDLDASVAIYTTASAMNDDGFMSYRMLPFTKNRLSTRRKVKYINYLGRTDPDAAWARLVRDLEDRPGRPVVIYLTRGKVPEFRKGKNSALDRIAEADFPVVLAATKEDRNLEILLPIAISTGGEMVSFSKKEAKQKGLSLSGLIASEVKDAIDRIYSSQILLTYPLENFSSPNDRLLRVTWKGQGEDVFELHDSQMVQLSPELLSEAASKRMDAIRKDMDQHIGPCSGIAEFLTELDNLDRKRQFSRVTDSASERLATLFPTNGAVCVNAREKLSACGEGFADEDTDNREQLKSQLNQIGAVESSLRLRVLAADLGQMIASEKVEPRVHDGIVKYLNEWISSHPALGATPGFTEVDSNIDGFLDRCLERHVKVEKIRWQQEGARGLAESEQRIKEDIRVLALGNNPRQRPLGLMRLLLAQLLFSKGTPSESVVAAEAGLGELKPATPTDANHWLDLAVYHLAAGSERGARSAGRQAWQLLPKALLDDPRPEINEVLFMLGEDFCKKEEVKLVVGVGIMLAKKGVMLEEETERAYPARWPAEYAFYLWQTGNEDVRPRVLPLMAAAWSRDADVMVASGGEKKPEELRQFAGWMVSNVAQTAPLLIAGAAREWNRLYDECDEETQQKLKAAVQPQARLAWCGGYRHDTFGKKDEHWIGLISSACGDDSSEASKLKGMEITDALREYLTKHAAHGYRDALCGPILDRCLADGVDPSVFLAPEEGGSVAWAAIRWYLKDGYDKSRVALLLSLASMPRLALAERPGAEVAARLAAARKDAVAGRFLVILGEHLLYKGNASRAVEIVRELEVGNYLDPGEDPRMAAMSGRALHMGRQLPAATPYLRNAEKGEREDVFALAGDNYLRLGKPDDALRLFSQWVNKAGDDDLNRARAGLFIAHSMNGQNADAETVLADVDLDDAALGPYIPWIREAQAHRLCAEGELDKAAKAWREWGYKMDDLLRLRKYDRFRPLEGCEVKGG